MTPNSETTKLNDDRFQATKVQYLRIAICGLLMGVADIVPGVSGGTVALVTGIYHRLVAAIGNFDRHLLRLLQQRDFKTASRHIDLIFLITLLAGAGAGMVIAVFTISNLISSPNSRKFVLAVFFGLVLGAVWVVLDMIRSRKPHPATKHGVVDRQVCWWTFLIGLIVASAISWISPGHASGTMPLWYVFLCGAVAICAMILPGISGALILLLLGAYEYVIDALKGLLQNVDSSHNLVVVIVFVTGCVIGLLGFSKLLRWLLDRRYAVTMSLMCGLMGGSLLKLWPFQTDTTPTVEAFKHKVFKPAFPTEFNLELLIILASIIGSACMVMSIHYLASRKKPAGAGDSTIE